MASDLTEMCMKQQDALFTLEGTDFYGLVHWLNENTSRLQEKGFLIEQESGGREIVIGKSHINLEFRENNDWFDTHARVQFGEYEIPFLDLKNHILNRIREFELDRKSTRLNSSH